MVEFCRKPSGTFLDDARWNSDHMAVKWTLLLNDDNREHRVRCRVSHEALEDADLTRDPLDAEKALRLFEKFKAQISGVLDRKLKGGHFEPDGPLFVRTKELNP